uniref:WD40 repeat n=1 Tax=Candidatus Kentrum sp. LPFa TaxID=2126335 RepID=A0A450W2T6_9GAMM|nr:MAG: WD40 repeat [Candidatus Kentron sp. LPFa]VFK29398.1 MAG: WD40 repeat [Candidatus Kentron sp. LPFa]
MTKRPQDSPHPALRLRHTLRGHHDAVYRMALSPNGRVLASSSRNRTVWLWAVENGRPLRALPHPGRVTCVAWSPDGARLATGGASKNRKVTLWDAGGRRIRVLGQHGDIVMSVAWSPDGKRLASCSYDRTIRLWDLAGRRVPRTFSGHTGRVHGIVWSPEGGRLCSCAEDRTLRLWDVGRGETIRTLAGHKNNVNCVAWSPDGRSIASGSDDRMVRLWNPETGRQRVELEGHSNRVLSVAFLDTGRLLAALGWDGRLILWRTEDWAQVMRVDRIGCTDSHSNLAVHPTLPLMAVRGSDPKENNLWVIDFDLLRGMEATQSTVYVNAKAVLLGDSGVGKSGLGIRMADKEFRETSSTHGAQFWHFPTGRLPGLPGHIQAELTLCGTWPVSRSIA